MSLESPHESSKRDTDDRESQNQSMLTRSLFEREQSRQAEYDRLTALPRSRRRTLRQCPVEQPYVVRALSQRNSLVKLDARDPG
jgi:hypothetical protein